MTRKGLAFGSGAALIAASLSGAPAFALGTQNGFVELDPQAGTSYGMLTGQVFDLAANFSTAADNGTPLKFMVTDDNSISNFDIDLGTSDTLTLNANDAIVKYAASNGTADSISIYHGNNKTAHNVEVGDAIEIDSFNDADSSLFANTTINGLHQVTGVSATNLTVAGAGSDAANGAEITVTVGATLDTFVIDAKTAHGLSVGDIVTLTDIVSTEILKDGSGAALGASTATALNADHVVRAISGTTFTVIADGGANAVAGEFDIALTASTFDIDSNSITFETAVEVTSSFLNPSDGADDMGDVVEATDANSLDDADELLVAAFGVATSSGVAVQDTDDASANRNTDGSYIVDSNDTDDAGADQVLRLVASAAGTVSVQAWIDSDDDNVIDGSEYASEVRTVTFTNAADATFTTTFDAPVTGTSSNNLVAYVSIAPAINLAQFASGDVEVDFGNNGASTDANVDTAYDSVTKLLKGTASESAGGADIFYAEAQYGANNSLVTLANFGGKVYGTTLAGSADIGASNNTAAGVSAPAIAVGPNWNGTNVRSGTTAVQAVSDVTTYVASGTAPAAPAGIQANVTITKSVLASGSTVVAGGKTLSSTGTSITYSTTTNADGEVVVDMVATGKKNDSVVVRVSVLDSNGANADAYVNSASDLTVTWADATLATSNEVIELNTYGDANADGTMDAERSLAKGGSMTLNYMVRDSFGQPFTAAGYRLAITSSSVTGGGSVSGTAAVTNGLANFTFTDNTVAAAGVYTIEADLQKLNTAGDAYAQVDASSDRDVVVNVGLAAAATITAPADYVSTDSKEGLEVKAVKAFDGRKVAETFPYTSANGHQIVGVVKSAVGGGLAGQPVTISAAGIGFITDDTSTDEVAAVGSITVYTNSSGAYSVHAYSNMAGSKTFTITSGSATKSHSWTYAEAASTAGTSLVIDAPSSVLPGSTFKVTAKITDKYGNPVNTTPHTNNGIRITYTGAGIVFGTLPTDTGVTGEASFAVLLGSNDSGTGVVTVSYDQSDDNDFTGVTTADADLTVSKSIAIGTGADLVSSWTKKLDAGSAKIYAKNIVGAGKVQFMLNGEEIAWVRATSAADSKLRTANGASYLVRTVDLVKGQKNVLEVYVDGVRTTRTAYTY